MRLQTCNAKYFIAYNSEIWEETLLNMEYEVLLLVITLQSPYQQKGVQEAADDAS